MAKSNAQRQKEWRQRNKHRFTYLRIEKEHKKVLKRVSKEVGISQEKTIRLFCDMYEALKKEGLI